ncbi:unnamed protein product [Mytilus coruscus]|uniref:Uncharacterized protein n=1 Tax=Mytilus coruscus TaxID=42192 RepID=A0A6J8F339_MYTCO|nr:unnamed protein product [Mytilus coruscus]
MFVGYFDVEDSNNVNSCQQEIVTLEPFASTSRQREDAFQCVNIRIHDHDSDRVDDSQEGLGQKPISSSDETLDKRTEYVSADKFDAFMERHDNQLSLITASLQSLSEGFSYYEEECDYEEDLDSVEASRGSDSNSCAIPQCTANDVPNVNKDGSAQQTTVVVDDGNSFDASQLLNEKISEFSTEEKVGPNVSDNLGMFVNSLLTTQMTLTKRNELFDKYLRPGNCQLNFPTVNDVIYEQCIGSFGRSNDVKLHTIQRVLLKGLTPLVILVNKLVSGTEVPDKKELSQTMLDSRALLATSSYSLSQYRRTNLKQYLKDDYQSLCTPKTKLTDQLFGDDVVNKIKSLTEGKKMAVMVAQKHNFLTPLPLEVLVVLEDLEVLAVVVEALPGEEADVF